MDDATLLELLRRGHLTMEERLARGLWPHPPLRRRDLARLIARVVRRDGCFPHPFEPHVPGQPVSEYGVIERRGRLLYAYRAHRHHPLDPFTLVETCDLKFLSPVAAAHHYLRFDLGLPGELDGWEVL